MVEYSRGAGAVELLGHVQNYDWGIVGEASLVAKLYNENGGAAMNESRPYAELWMGTHASGPSHVKTPRNNQPQLLRDYLCQDLPFLFKVLSVAKALSIQAHPNRELAQRLHHAQPQHYKDANHKPEMAIALSDFEALCGFRTTREISGFAGQYPPFKALIGGDMDESTNGLKQAFTNLMNQDANAVQQAIAQMPQTGDDLIALFHRLNRQYPGGDVGVFCVFFLHYICLKPGQAIFLAANEPHAYLSGSCVECMATSDNVVRAGLTPKYRDVATLCEMLTYRQFASADELLLQPKKMRPFASVYESPVPEFSVMQINVPIEHEEELPGMGQSIVLCVSGSGRLVTDAAEYALRAGTIVYLPENTTYKVVNSSTVSAENQSCLLYQAFQPSQ